jgi:hypothetical protein
MGQTAIGRPRLTPRFKDTSPTVFDTFGQSLARRGKRGINTLLDLLSGSTPEEEAQNAVFSLMPGGMVVGPVRRGISKAAGPTTRRLLSPSQEIISYHGSSAPSFPPTPRNPLGEFDLGKIGTGEGSQMYGQGIYSSAELPIGDTYRQMYARKEPDFSGYVHPEGVTAWRQRHQGARELWKHKPPQTISNDPVINLSEVRQAALRAADNLNKSQFFQPQFNRHYSQSDIGEAVRFVEDRVLFGGIPAEDIIKVVDGPSTLESIYVRDHKNLLEAVIEPWKGLKYKHVPGESPGSLFEVGIRASPEELIDLGKPLTGQSPQVQSSVRSIFDPLQIRHGASLRNMGISSGGSPTVEPLLTFGSKAEQMSAFNKFKDFKRVMREAKYGTETSWPSPLFADPGAALNAARTQLLRDRGVPGAQYLGHTSNKRNYVIWDPERLNILRKLATGVGAVGTGAAAASQIPGTTSQN